MGFDDFVALAGPRLRGALVATFGPDVGADAAAEALAYGWQHWSRVSGMANPTGYLYRVGQTCGRRARQRANSRTGSVDRAVSAEMPWSEPGLVPALQQLSESQRVVVIMVHALGWAQTEVAEVLEISASSVRTHLARGMARLQRLMEVDRVR
jgi:RNA polymerase sigma-70 factor (ECF subfamily)